MLAYGMITWYEGHQWRQPSYSMSQKGEIAVHDDAILAQVEGARFYSITYRLFKLPDLLEPASEDYGHVATYKVSPQSLLHAELLGTTLLPDFQAS